MRRFAKIIMTVLALALSFVSPANAGMSAGKVLVISDFKVPSHTFAECCPRPKWWNSVDAPVISTKKELLKIWQDRAIEKNVKAKAFFRAMMDFDGKDDDIVSTAISLYQYVDRDYPNKTQMLEFGVGRFIEHKRSLKGYGGKTGDTSAGLVKKLARRYLRSKQPDAAAAVIAKLIYTRENEINQHLLESLSLSMIDALKALGRHEDAFAVASYAITNYDGDWEKQLEKKRDALRPSISMSQQILLPFSKWLILMLLGLVIAIPLIGIFLWSRRDTPHTEAVNIFRYGRN